jgi:hypothetical protein
MSPCEILIQEYWFRSVFWFVLANVRVIFTLLRLRIFTLVCLAFLSKLQGNMHRFLMNSLSLFRSLLPLDVRLLKNSSLRLVRNKQVNDHRGSKIRLPCLGHSRSKLSININFFLAQNAHHTAFSFHHVSLLRVHFQLWFSKFDIHPKNLVPNCTWALEIVQP